MKQFKLLFTTFLLLSTSFFVFGQDVEYSGLHHSPINNSSLVIEDNNLIITNPGSAQLGASIDMGNHDGIDFIFEPLQVGEGASFEMYLHDQSSELISAMFVKNIGREDKEFSVQLQGGESYTVSAYLDGDLVYQEEAVVDNDRLAWWVIPLATYVADNIDAHYNSTTTTTTDAQGNVTTTTTTSGGVSWGGVANGGGGNNGNNGTPAELQLPNGEMIVADIILVEVTREVPAEYELGQLDLIGNNMSSVVITNEFAFQNEEENGLTFDPNPSIESIPVEMEGQLNLNIFPNPTTDQLTIEYYLPESDKVSLTLQDLTGKEVLKSVSPDHEDQGYHQLRLDVSMIQSGIYFYTIQSGEYQESKKVVVKK